MQRKIVDVANYEDSANNRKLVNKAYYTNDADATEGVDSVDAADETKCAKFYRCRNGTDCADCKYDMKSADGLNGKNNANGEGSVDSKKFAENESDIDVSEG